MTGNVLKEIEENIKDYEEQGIEQIPLSLVKYWISVLEKENEQLEETREYYQENFLTMKTERNQFKRENEQLKQAYAQLRHRHSLLHDECIDAECDRDSYCKDIASLEKENEQLKSFNQDLSENLSVCADKRLAQGEHLTKLTNENEQLKHSIKCLEADKMELQQYIKRMQGDVE